MTLAARESERITTIEPVEHPVVRTHDETGEEILYVNPGFTRGIKELEPAEAQALLTFLYQHSIRPQFTVRWHWNQGEAGHRGPAALPTPRAHSRLPATSCRLLHSSSFAFLLGDVTESESVGPVGVAFDDVVAVRDQQAVVIRAHGCEVAAVVGSVPRAGLQVVDLESQSSVTARPSTSPIPADDRPSAFR